jgi:uncharacterized protein (DUF1501 family)
MNPVQPFTRREFVTRGLGLVGLGATVPSFLFDTVAALAAGDAAGAGGKDGRILVVVQLAGGNDGLNTVVPFAADAYYEHRPRLAIPRGDVLKLDDNLGLHPKAEALKQLWDDGRLSIVQNVGYPNPNRSHFVGTRIWQTASPDERMHEGWLGRYFDSECKGADPDPKMGIALTDEMPLGMMGRKFMPIATDDPRNWQFRGADRVESIAGADQPAPADADQDMHDGETDDAKRGRKPAAPDVMTFLRRSTLDTAVCVEEIRAAARKEIAGARFPRGRLSQSLENVARMIVAGLPTKVYYVTLGGFDTHANQGDRHGNLLRELGTAIQAFVRAMEKTGNLSRVVLMTFSEFGRRVAENASGGTDHGEAAPLFVVGDAVKPGLVGNSPDLSKLHRGDVAFDLDFRRVYSTMLKGWLSADADRILGGKFQALPILK